MTTLVLQEAPAKEKRHLSGYEKVRLEIDDYLETMQELNTKEAGEVFLLLSGWTARMTELRIQLSRDKSQASRALLTKEIDPFIEECERQFRYHSRNHTTRDLEFRLSGGTT